MPDPPKPHGTPAAVRRARKRELEAQREERFAKLAQSIVERPETLELLLAAGLGTISLYPMDAQKTGYETLTSAAMPGGMMHYTLDQRFAFTTPLASTIGMIGGSISLGILGTFELKLGGKTLEINIKSTFDYYPPGDSRHNPDTYWGLLYNAGQENLMKLKFYMILAGAGAGVTTLSLMKGIGAMLASRAAKK